MPRKVRKGEYTCECSVYGFPHRFGGGKCSGKNIVEEQWNSSYGFSGVCVSCNCLNDRSHSLECDVINGAESAKHCEALIEFVEFNEIKLYD